MKKHTFLRQHVFHDGKQMIVAKAGDKFEVPADQLADMIASKAIEDPHSKDEDEFESSGFTMKHVGFGKYEITGPGLDTPETVKGRDVAEGRLAQLAKRQVVPAPAAADGAPPAE